MMLKIGNPTNIYLAESYGISFLTYVGVMAIPTVIAEVVSLLCLWLLFRRRLSAPLLCEPSPVTLPDKPSLILCRDGSMPLCDVGRPHLSYGARAALLRPPLLLFSSLLLSSVAILPGGPLDFAALVKILSGVFGVTMAAFSGYSAGCQHIRWESGKNERRILFLSSFYQEEGIEIPKEAF